MKLILDKYETFEEYRKAVRELSQTLLIASEDRLSLEEGIPEDLTDALRDIGLFGISIPRLVFPGCEEILAEREDMALAMSSDNPIILLDLTPAFGINSNKVTIGPVLYPTILPSTPYS